MAGESDLRLLLERKAKGEMEAEKTIASFVYQIKKAIGSYAVVLGGLDAIILTATASERSSILRQLILSELTLLGLKLDIEKTKFVSVATA